MEPIDTPVNVCFICGYKMDAATLIKGDENTPKEGDVSVCMKCGDIQVFNKDLTLRDPSPEENEVFARDAFLWSVVRQIRNRNIEKARKSN